MKTTLFLEDLALQLSRLSGPALETYARTAAALLPEMITECSALTSCRNHWKTSFEHERRNVIRLRRELAEYHQEEQPDGSCACYDCKTLRKHNEPQAT